MVVVGCVGTVVVVAEDGVEVVVPETRTGVAVVTVELFVGGVVPLDFLLYLD